MSRVAALFAVIAVVSAASAAQARNDVVWIGPTQFLTPGFGFAVVGSGLFAYRDGRWTDVTPPHAAGFVEDVAFADPLHGWVGTYDGGTVRVTVYRTTDGGRSWARLTDRFTHSMGGGPAFLSAVGASRAWIEPVSPNGPGGELFGTRNGGRAWTSLVTADDFGARAGSLPCLAPIRFVSGSVGWMARCRSAVFVTRDGGRSWAKLAMPGTGSGKARLFDLPRFFGKQGVVAATVGESVQSGPAGGRAEAVSFAVTGDGGRTWSLRAVRRFAPCDVRRSDPFYVATWPAGIATPRVWWLVGGATVQLTTDAGRHWQTVAARGLPGSACAVSSVSAVSSREAWVVAGKDDRGNGLYRTRDGGRTWHRVVP